MVLLDVIWIVQSNANVSVASYCSWKQSCKHSVFAFREFACGATPGQARVLLQVQVQAQVKFKKRKKYSGIRVWDTDATQFIFFVVFSPLSAIN